MLILLLGCTEMSRQERNLCYSMANKSYSYIPVCETENSCFEKVNEMFKTKLGYEQESRLYELKNSLARSWFFYNKGTAEMKKISSQCLSGSTITLVGSINQARYYFDESFALADETIKKSAEIVFEEEKLLSSQKIDVLKEEKLFDSLIELRQILSDFSGEKTNSGTYVSYYFEKVNLFKNSAASKGFNYLVEKESFWEKEYDFVEDNFASQISPVREVYLAPIRDMMDSLWGFAENYIYKTESLTELQRIPTYELMVLYSNIAGNNNSAIKRFSDLMNSNSANYENLIKTKGDLLEENYSLQKECKSILSESEQYDKYSELVKRMITKSASQEFNPEKEFDSAEQQFLIVREKMSNNSSSIGETINELKEIKETFMKIKEAITYSTKERESKISEFCDLEATESKGLIENPPAELIRLSNDIAFYSSKVTTTRGIEKLNYCLELVIKKDNYIIGKNNYAELQSKKVDQTRTCFSELEEIFLLVKLEELELEFKKLKETTVTSENILYFDEACQSIKTQAENEVYDIYDLGELFNKYEKVKSNLNLLEEVCSALTSCKIEELKNKFTELTNPLRNSSLITISTSSKTLMLELEKINSQTNLNLEEKISEYAKKNVKINLLPSSIPKTNTKNAYTAEIIFSNPFQRVNVAGVVAFEVSSRIVISADSCINNVIFGEKTIISYNCIDLGEMKVKISGESILETEEVVSVIYASNEKSLIKKEIIVKSDAFFPKLQVETKSLSPDYTITSGEKEILAEKEGTALFFYIDNFEKEKIILLFYVNNLITSDFILQNTLPVSLNGNKLHYSFSAKNNYAESINATLFIPINKNETITSVLIFDSTGKEIKYEKVGDKLAIKNTIFIASETKKFELTIYTNGNYFYYINALNSSISKLSLIENEPLIKQITALINSEPGNDFVKQAELLLKEAEKVISLKENENDSQKRLALLAESLKQLITNAEKYGTELIKAGLEKTESEFKEKIDYATNALLTMDEKELGKAISALTGTKFDINQAILSESENIVKTLKAVKTDNLQLKQMILDSVEIKQLIERLISTDPLKAKNEFLLLAQLKTKFDELYLEIYDTNKTSEKAIEIKQNCVALIGLIKAELSADETALVNSKFIKPITLSRIDSLEKKINEIDKSALSISEKESQFIEIYGELKSAYDSIKRQSINLFNSAIDAKTSSIALEKAKEFIDSNKYVSAFLILSGTEKDNFFENIPFISFIPIIILLLVAIIIKKSTKRSESANSQTKKEVEDAWTE